MKYILGVLLLTMAANGVRAVENRAADALRINAGHLQQALEELSTFGRPVGGSFADGVSRVAYSDADVAGRRYVMQLMRDAGLEPQIDTAGNIHGVRQGSRPGSKPIMFGSHIDSVPNGGNFDGELGSLAAIEVIRALRDAKIQTHHPLEVVVWSNEEGGTIGSHSAISAVGTSTLDRAFNGITLRQGLPKIGGDPLRLDEARRAPQSIDCYLELHIEQGPTLDRAAVPIGVVDGIVSIDEYEVEIQGLPPALASRAVQEQIESAAAVLGLKTMHLPSGAGHDAQNIAQIAPMGMIFVPSVRGISHSPKELTRWSDCANGANVLLQTILRMDRT